MRKLLKFAAPILILALIFASCDDRGKNPGGSTSDGITVQVALPAGIYDGAAWQMSLAAGEDAEPIEAKSVSFVPAKDAEGGKALVIGKGFSEEAIATGISSITVTYTLQNGSVYQASATPSGIGDIMSKTISAEVASGAWKSKTPQTITLTVTGQTPANAEGVEAAQLKTTGWTITMAETGKAPIAVADYEAKVTQQASYSESSGKPSIVSIAFSAGKNSIPDGTYTATVQYGTGDGMLQGSSASTISVEAGQANPGAAAVQLNPTNGQITVKIPENIAIGDDEVAVTDASISYILTPGSASPVTGTAGKLTEGEGLYTFTINGLEAPAEAVKYSITVIATYNGADYVVEASGQFDGPTSKAAIAEEDLSGESFAGISLEVTFAGGSLSSSLPTDGSLAVTYVACDSKGNPVPGAESASAPVNSTTVSSLKLTISGLKFNAQYLVSAALDTSATVYSGSGYNATATAAGSSNSASVQLLITGGAVSLSSLSIGTSSILYEGNSGLQSSGAASATAAKGALKIGGSFTAAEAGITMASGAITVNGSISASDLGVAMPLSGTITAASKTYEILPGSFVTFYQSKTGVISATATITTGDGVDED